MLLPEFGTDPGQTAFTPQRLQAMAHVTLYLQSPDPNGEGPVMDARKAVELYPDSAVAYYYLGECLRLWNKAAAKTVFEKAETLGDAQAAKAAHVELKEAFNAQP